MLVWAYDLPDDRLVNATLEAWSRAGFSCSGLVQDAMAATDADEAHYLKGVLLARLAGLKPPFKLHDIVGGRSDRPTQSVDWWGGSLAIGTQHKIERVYYREGKWILRFKDVPFCGRGYPRFLASDFVLVAPAKVAG